MGLPCGVLVPARTNPHPLVLNLLPDLRGPVAEVHRLGATASLTSSIHVLGTDDLSFSPD
jgi:hypothetical protein